MSTRSIPRRSWRYAHSGPAAEPVPASSASGAAGLAVERPRLRVPEIGIDGDEVEDAAAARLSSASSPAYVGAQRASTSGLRTGAMRWR